MIEMIVDGFDFIVTRTPGQMLLLLWFVVVFEFPRYLIAFLLVPFYRRHHGSGPVDLDLPVTVILAGHSEERKIERCVLGLHEQSRPPDQIIVVSDGSTDRTDEKLRDLARRGLVDIAHSTDLRGGKSAALNLALRWATGEIVVCVDCDCSFDPHSIRNILRPFADPETDAVSGNVYPRNAESTLITTFQAIEYLISISLSRQAHDLFGQVSCISGAFGAYRMAALREAGGLDAGGGEDLDLTLRVRNAGGNVRFAHEAICFTDVPETLTKLVRQRLRWERDAIELRFRKHRAIWNVFGSRLYTREVMHNLEFLLFSVVSGFALPIYVIWLFYHFGEFAPSILLAVHFALSIVDFVTLIVAGHVSPGISVRRLLPFLPGYSLFNSFFMRGVRCVAYTQEWVFRTSFKDAYVPEKVQRSRV